MLAVIVLLDASDSSLLSDDPAVPGLDLHTEAGTV